MTFSCSTKRLLAGAASAFLLLCQTAMAMETCGLAPEVAAEGASGGHCHGIASQPGNESGRVQEQNCPTGYPSAGLAQLDIPQAADLPALEAWSGWLQSPVRNGLNPVAPPPRAEPPPLIIVHCCLRN
jgi:hypothetical protein